MRCRQDYVVVIQGEKQTERRGIVLPDMAQEDSFKGEVIAVGPDVEDIEIGDHILIPISAYVRVMRTQKFDFSVSIDGEDKPAIVVKAEEIAVVWPREDGVQV